MPQFPWDAGTDTDNLRELLERWKGHMQELSEAEGQLGGAKDATDAEPVRRAVARALLAHEKQMAVEQAVAVKKRLKELVGCEP